MSVTSILEREPGTLTDAERELLTRTRHDRFLMELEREEQREQRSWLRQPVLVMLLSIAAGAALTGTVVALTVLLALHT